MSGAVATLPDVAPGIAMYCEAPQVSQEQAALIARAADIFSQRDVCPAWSRLPVAVGFYRYKEDIPAGTPTIPLLDHGDDPEALAYHTAGANGRIWGLVDVAACIAAGGGILAGGPSVASAFMHEVGETEINCYVGGWEDMPDGEHEVSREICDPVQDMSYAITVEGEEVDASNFVFPQWFNRWPNPGARFDFMGALKEPFTRTGGGYMVKRKGGRVIQDGMTPAHKPDSPLRRIARMAGRRASLVLGGRVLDDYTIGAIVARAHDIGQAHAQVVADVVARERAALAKALARAASRAAS